MSLLTFFNEKYFFTINFEHKCLKTIKILERLKFKIYLKNDLLATGIDSAGRTQYIYSDKSKRKRELKKYNQIYNLSKNINKLKANNYQQVLENSTEDY